MENLKKRLEALEVSVAKCLIPGENLTEGVSSTDAKFLWSDYNKLLIDFKRHSDVFGEYREVSEPKPMLMDSKFTAPIIGYKFESLKPLSRQINALKAVIEQNYL